MLLRQLKLFAHRGTTLLEGVNMTYAFLEPEQRPTDINWTIISTEQTSRVERRTLAGWPEGRGQEKAAEDPTLSFARIQATHEGSTEPACRQR
jgi:hypothetical protein